MFCKKLEENNSTKTTSDTEILSERKTIGIGEVYNDDNGNRNEVIISTVDQFNVTEDDPDQAEMDPLDAIESNVECFPLTDGRIFIADDTNNESLCNDSDLLRSPFDGNNTIATMERIES